MRLYSLLALLLLVSSLTLVLQKWVGGVTVYQPELAERRQILHEAIFHNRLPHGSSSWTEAGANDVNVRVGTVYFVEFLHRASGFNVLTIYQVLDTVALFAALLLVFGYLRQTNQPPYALIGLLYVAAILPLTYFFGYFHPWDRVSLACWAGLLMLLRNERLIAFAVLLVASIIIKYDTVLLPTLYFLAKVTRQNWPQVALRAALLFALSFGVWIGLRLLLPGGFEERHLIAQLLSNLRDFRATWYAYPPLLGLGLSILLAFAGLRWSDRFSRASVVFGLLLLVPFFTRSNFIEMRAEMPVLLLMLPSALAALRVLCEGEGHAEGTSDLHAAGEPTGPQPQRSLLSIDE
jgi:hypothetical protein